MINKLLNWLRLKKSNWSQSANADLAALRQWEVAQKTPIEQTNNPTIQYLLDAAATKKSVNIAYHGGQYAGLRRTVTPTGVFHVEGYTTPYLKAFCHSRNEQRNFRIDRISLI
jgi:predicted DNA-binding transcriptional regulator YafY